MQLQVEIRYEFHELTRIEFFNFASVSSLLPPIMYQHVQTGDPLGSEGQAENDDEDLDQHLIDVEFEPIDSGGSEPMNGKWRMCQVEKQQEKDCAHGRQTGKQTCHQHHTHYHQPPNSDAIRQSQPGRVCSQLGKLRTQRARG
jgi:hypothetical protein